MKESTINETMSPAAHQAAKPRRRKVKESRGDRIYYAIVYTILILLALIVIYPLYFVVIASFSRADAVLAGRVFLYPVDIDFTGYIRCFERMDIWIGYGNTIYYTISYTVLSVLFTVTAAWALSRRRRHGRSPERRFPSGNSG